jgi:hypothetical protein
VVKCFFCGNQAEFEVSFGAEDKAFRVCRWCLQDFELLGLCINQVVRIARRSAALSLVQVLGPVFSLAEAHQ